MTGVGGVGSAWAAKPVTEWVARSTGAQSVALIEGEKPGTWIDLKNGGILDERPTTDATRTTHGGRMIWVENRLVEDREGGTHVFHRQRYIPGIQRHGAGLKIPTNGFPLRGSSLGFHSDASGHLFGIAGTRFEDVKVVIKPAVVTARGALENAITGARAQRSDVVFLENLAVLVGRNGVVSKIGERKLVAIGTVLDPPCIEYQDLTGLESARNALLAIGYPPSVPVRSCD